MKNKIKILVVGVGNMGASHARSYHKLPEFEIVGLVSRTPKRRAPLAKELGDIPQFDDVDKALQQTKPDAVSINTYPDTHKLFAIKSLKAGAHIFIEKPLAESISDAEEIIELAKTLKKKVVVGYILRHHPAWIKFIKMSHNLGKPLVMRMNLNQQSSGGLWETHKSLMKSMSPIVDCGVHYVDVMCQMTQSQPMRVYAIGAKLTEEVQEDMYNYGNLQVTFEDGSVGWYEAGWGPMMSETAFFVKDVIGPRGSVSIVDPKDSNQITSSDVNHHTKTNQFLIHHQERDENGAFMMKDEYIDTSNEPSHQELCDREQQSFGKAILEDADLTTHLNDAVNSLKIVLAADESIRSGQSISL